MNDDSVTLDTDGAFMRELEELIRPAFPGSRRTVEGPIQKAVQPDEAIQWAFIGTQAFFTITGGAGPAIAYFRAAVDYLRDGYRTAMARQESPRPTVLKYRNREVTLNAEGIRISETQLEIPWDDPKVAERVVEDLFTDSD